MTTTTPLSLRDRLEKDLPELLELRRHLHAHPELSGEEHQTAALVAGDLRGLGWRVQEAVGRTGVLAELGPDDGPTVGLRVDMDALPVEERTGLAYASTHQGVMHACGHDLHTCVGLGVARLLAAAAPLLGLLGTVMGMLDTFESLSQRAQETTSQVSSGVRFALVTTQAGLTVAIPAIFVIQWIRREAQKRQRELVRAEFVAIHGEGGET